MAPIAQPVDRAYATPERTMRSRVLDFGRRTVFEVARFIVNKRMRGGWRLLRTLREPIRYELENGIAVFVPMARNKYYWTPGGPAAYEECLITRLAQAAHRIKGPIAFIDAGADIGLIGLRLRARVPHITAVTAVEPNSEVFPVLSRNVRMIGGRALNSAVSDFAGRGVLRAPAYHPEEHGRYLVPDAAGDIDVVTIDSLGIRAENVMLKMDVEGSELAALRGAQETIRNATRIVIALEAHPLVSARTHIDPIEYIKFLTSLRPFRFSIAENGQEIGAEDKLFGQLAPDAVFNLIAESC
jgi:FkbM family methyltransferase